MAMRKEPGKVLLALRVHWGKAWGLGTGMAMHENELAVLPTCPFGDPSNKRRVQFRFKAPAAAVITRRGKLNLTDKKFQFAVALLGLACVQDCATFDLPAGYFASDSFGVVGGKYEVNHRAEHSRCLITLRYLARVS